MKTILVVDDSKSLLEVLEMTLVNEGYKVFTAANGNAAYKLAGLRYFDLVITDLNMPVMNGLDLTKLLRGLDHMRFTPIIFLTTESQLSKKEAAKAAGATGWIVKPFKPEKLISVVKRVIG